MRARALLNYAISVAAIIAFAYINAFFPQMFFSLFVLYLLVTMGVMMLITGRAVSRAVKDYEYVERGKTLLKVSREVVRRLRERDRVALASELKSQWGYNGALLRTVHSVRDYSRLTCVERRF